MSLHRFAFVVSIVGLLYSTSFVFAESEDGQYIEAATCIQQAGEVYNAQVHLCLNQAGERYAENLLSVEEYTAQVTACPKGQVFEAYERGMAVCYQSHSLGSVWDLPVMKQALTSQFKHLSTLTQEQSQKIGTCVEDLQKTYTLSIPSPDVQRAIAACFSLGGLTGLEDVYKKAATTLDCAAEIKEKKGFSTFRELMQYKTPEDELFVKECVIKRTAPVAAVVAVANIPFASGFHNTFVFIQFLFTQPLVLLARRKVGSTGMIFNSLTRQPLDLSIVRLIDTKKDTVVKSMVTGHNGMYFFLPTPGKYRVEVDKQGFAFPSALLKNNAQEELYFGELIAVKTREHVVDKHVPVDPHEEGLSRRAFLWKKWKRRIVFSAAAIGPAVSFFGAIMDPRYVTVGLFVLHIGLLSIFFRLNKKREVKYGTIYSSEKQMVSGATVSLFSKQYQKLIGYYVSDMFGRYFFPAVTGDFLVTVEKTGYKKQEIILTIDEKSLKKGYIGTDIHLQK